MREILHQIAEWHRTGIDCATATIVAATGSAPCPVGSVMVFADTGTVAGGLTGGCIESDLWHVAVAVMETGRPELRRYSDTDGINAIGLVCGGSIEVLVQPAGASRLPGLVAMSDAIDGGRPVVLATLVGRGRSMVVTADAVAGTGGGPRLDAAVVGLARACLVGNTAVTTYRESIDGERVVFTSIPSPPRLVVYGAVDLARPLIRAATVLGFTTTLCDPRAVFATTQRFPEADEVVVDRPHHHLASVDILPSTAICVLTHDPRFDVPTLMIALRSAAGYVGAMGSRRTHRDRVRRLRAEGITDTELARLCAPIGLDLGAVTPAETAVSILAEIVAKRRGGSGRALTALDGPIHRANESLLDIVTTVNPS
ncbi:XdhC family protein [Rhodococcus gannanensis]|uniref:XdhC family protein n=1 Tax=Rhodococcus gannanensis TaxID=1960308 RepID=A0ABW4PAR7_9NOCA